MTQHRLEVVQAACRRHGVDPVTARAEALAAVPGVGPSKLAQLLTARGEGAATPCPTCGGITMMTKEIARRLCAQVDEAKASLRWKSEVVVNGVRLTPVRQYGSIVSWRVEDLVEDA